MISQSFLSDRLGSHPGLAFHQAQCLGHMTLLGAHKKSLLFSVQSKKLHQYCYHITFPSWRKGRAHQRHHGALITPISYLPHREKKDTNIRVRRARFSKETLSTIASSHLSTAPLFKDKFVGLWFTYSESHFFYGTVLWVLTNTYSCEPITTIKM